MSFPVWEKKSDIIYVKVTLCVASCFVYILDMLLAFRKRECSKQATGYLQNSHLFYSTGPNCRLPMKMKSIGFGETKVGLG